MFLTLYFWWLPFLFSPDTHTDGPGGVTGSRTQISWLSVIVGKILVVFSGDFWKKFLFEKVPWMSGWGMLISSYGFFFKSIHSRATCSLPFIFFQPILLNLKNCIFLLFLVFSQSICNMPALLMFAFENFQLCYAATLLTFPQNFSSYSCRVWKYP